MNYLAEILAFNNWIEFNSEINKSDICLWHALMHIANRFAFREFSVPISKLILISKLDRTTLYRARNKLRQFDLIAFRERPSKQSALYTMKSLASQYGTQHGTQHGTQGDTQDDTQGDTHYGNINKIKNKIPKTKNQIHSFYSDSADMNINKSALGEFNNVLLSDNELNSLKSKFDDWQNKIELLSEYIASSGKHYKSHYATILNWARKESNSNNKSITYQKRTPKKLCTDYD